MSNFWSYIILTACCVALSAALRGNLWGSKDRPDDPYLRLTTELQMVLAQPNEWGYTISCMHQPYLDETSLTHRLFFLADLVGARFTAINDAESIHAKIYIKNLKLLNSMRNIRPFLDEFPLTPNTFQLSVGFIDEKGENFCPPYLVSVIMDTKNLEFNQFYKVEKAGHFKTILAKPLSNCTDLQECYHPIVKRSKPSIPPSVPTFSSPPVLTRLPADWTVFLFAKKMTADFGLNFVAFRNVYEEQSSFTPFQIALWGRHQLSLPEARKLTAKISHDFLHTVQTDKDALDFMQKAYNSPKTHLDALQPEKRHIALRLSFWDENIDRQPVPYIAEVRLYNEKITYYTADENQFLVPVLEESFDDAQAFSKEDLPK